MSEEKRKIETPKEKALFAARALQGIVKAVKSLRDAGGLYPWFRDSKKAKALVLGAVGNLAAIVLGDVLQMSPELVQMGVNSVTAPTATYMGAQGLADMGKEKAKIEEMPTHEKIKLRA